MRPKLFFDTDVCNAVEDGKIPPAEWERVLSHVYENYAYQVSAITLKEIFGGLARSPDASFEKNKSRLKAICQLKPKQFLPYPAFFVMQTILGLKNTVRRVFPPYPSEEVLYEKVCEGLLSGLSKKEIKTKLDFDLDHFDDHENIPQNKFADINQGLRDGRVEKFDPLKIARNLITDCREEPDEESCRKVVVALDAALTFSKQLSYQANNQQFNFKKHHTDWGDMMQLYYLCDESMRFVTLDRKCKSKANGSTQMSRILLYKEFLETM
jgi:hypothetical protein